MRILSLDLSTKSSGWCIGQNQKIEESGCIVAADKEPKQRIIIMRQQIKKLIVQKKIEKIVAQEVRPDLGLHTGILLRWLQGIIVIAAYQVNPKIEIQFLAVNTWRALLKIKQGKGIRRDDLKQQDIQYVKQKYGIIVNDDEADAICLYDAYWIQKNNELNWE